ncbi:unnamed protein product, partial [Meganyctiphanes norvegica]
TSSLSKEAYINVARTGLELPALNITIETDETTNFNSLDTTTVTISISHLETSLGEPIEVSVVVYVPIGGYVTYTGMTNSGVAPQTVGMVADKSSLNIKWGLLRFFESSEVVLSFTINPD